MKKQFEEHLYNPEIWNDPKNPKSRCIFNASGTGFDPDLFLSESKLSQQKGLIKGIIGLPDEIREKMKKKEIPNYAKEKIKNGAPTGEEFFKAFEIFETPFLLITVSEKTNIEAQVEEAILFLKNHLEDLAQLRTDYNVENISISFSAENCDSFKLEKLPKEFLDLCNRIGMSTSYGQSKTLADKS